MSALIDTVVLGTAGHAREIAWLLADVARASGSLHLEGYVTGDAGEIGSTIGDVPVLGTDAWLQTQSARRAVVLGIASPMLARRVLAPLLALPQLSFPTLRHPLAHAHTASMQAGRGNLVCAGAILSTDLRIGDFNLFNRGCQVGHDCRIGSHCVLNPGAILSGNVELGDDCVIGSGAVVLQNLRIGTGATVGAGAVVTRPVADGEVVAGVPARLLRKES